MRNVSLIFISPLDILLEPNRTRNQQKLAKPPDMCILNFNLNLTLATITQNAINNTIIQERIGLRLNYGQVLEFPFPLAILEAVVCPKGIGTNLAQDSSHGVARSCYCKTVWESFIIKRSVIGDLKNMPKTFSKCCLKNVLPLLFCNIMGMFIKKKKTFYNLLLQHLQNIFRMLHLKHSSSLIINIVGTLFEMINILKMFF